MPRSQKAFRDSFWQEYNQQVAAAVAFNAELRKSLRSADLQTSFSTDNKDTALFDVGFI